MKSDNFKVLIDGTGKNCQFNNGAFSAALKAKKEKYNAGAKQEKRKGTTLTELMHQIAEKSGFSDEAVKKWYQGYNGPSDYKAVSVAAKVLDVSESELVIPLSEKRKGMREMSTKERELVELIFSKCIEAFYEYADDLEAIHNNEDYERSQSQIEQSKAYGCFENKITQMHKVVACHTLNIDTTVADKLHNILLEFVDIYSPTDMERWQEICTVHIDNHSVNLIVDTNDLLKLEDCYTREDGVFWLGIWYIVYEIDFAERYGYLDTISLPDEFFDHVGLEGEVYREDDSEVPEEELLQYGCLEEHVSGHPFITPRMIYKDQVVTFLREVFKHDFPGMNM